MWIKSKGIIYISCHLNPNESILEFQEKLDLLEDAFCEEEGKALVSGNIKVRAVESWMSKHDIILTPESLPRW